MAGRGSGEAFIGSEACTSDARQTIATSSYLNALNLAASSENNAHDAEVRPPNVHCVAHARLRPAKKRERSDLVLIDSSVLSRTGTSRQVSMVPALTQ